MVLKFRFFPAGPLALRAEEKNDGPEVCDTGTRRLARHAAKSWGSISTIPTSVLRGVTFYGGEKALTIHTIFTCQCALNHCTCSVLGPSLGQDRLHLQSNEAGTADRRACRFLHTMKPVRYRTVLMHAGYPAYAYYSPLCSGLRCTACQISVHLPMTVPTVRRGCPSSAQRPHATRRGEPAKEIYL